MTVTAAQALYRERYAAPLRDGEPDLVAALRTERYICRNWHEYDCAACGLTIRGFGGLCMHLRGAAHVAKLTGYSCEEIAAGLAWIS